MTYTKIREIGEGGFSKVFKVQDTNGSFFAMKEFHYDQNDPFYSQAKRRFIRESTYQQSINHKNVVKITCIEPNADPPYYIMPLADSTLFKDIQDGTVDDSNYLGAMLDIMAGLEEMHSISLFHRDLKPANVLRFGDYYAIGDFGLMSYHQTGVTTITGSGLSKQSDMYTAPEIVMDLRHASIQSDIYSLGCILHDFVKTSNRIPCNEINESSEFGNIMLLSTRKDPSRRFKSVSDFREALTKLISEIAVVHTEIAERILASLDEKELANFNEKKIEQLCDFLSSSSNMVDKKAIMGAITIDHIDIIKSSRYYRAIAGNYFDYVKNESFRWEFCDTLANRTLAFIEDVSDLNLEIDAFFALLYMGTNHNRWYVEKKAAKMIRGDIDKKFTNRLIMEMKIESGSFCKALKHLLQSIDLELDDLNEEIVKSAKEICTNGLYRL